MDPYTTFTIHKFRRKAMTLNTISLRFCLGLLLGYCIASTLRRICVSGVTSSFQGTGRIVETSEPLLPSRPMASSKLVRIIPSNEMGSQKRDRELVLIGIMTAEKYLNTRAKAIYDTWAKTVPGKVLFFIGGGTVYQGELPVVTLHDVPAEDYPPQRKAFKMLQYMFDHYRHKFEWFIRADDDVFMKGDKIKSLLRSVDSSKLWYIGQSGEGVRDEFGKLGLLGDMPYCMGGPGVFFSHGALSKLGRFIPYCLNSVTTKHEDTEVGRCIQQAVGIGCTSSYEMRKLLYQNYGEKNGSFTHELGDVEKMAYTLHPLKRAPYVYRMQNFINGHNIVKLKQKVFKLENEIQNLENWIKHIVTDDTWREPQVDDATGTGYFLQKTASTPDNVRVWDYFNNGKYHTHKSVHIHLKPDGRADESVVNSAGQKVFRRMKESFPRSYIKFDKRLSSHIRISPVDGVDMDMSFRVSYLAQKTKRTRRFIAPYRLKQKFESWDFTEGKDNFRVFLNNKNSHPTDVVLRMLLPLSGRNEIFKRFIDIYSSVLKSSKVKVSLVVILFADDEDGHDKNRAYLEDYLSKNPSQDLKLIDRPHEEFSRAKALTYGSNIYGNDSLLLFMDVDMIFTTGFLKRVQLNAIQGKQVFFPLYFSQYDPNFICFQEGNCSVSNFDLSNQAGLWRYYGFGMVGVYKSDFLRVGGFNTSIVGWGEEDVDFFNRVLQLNLGAFRAADRGLIHLYHDKFCNKSLPADRWKMCMNSKADLWGSTRTLYRLVRNLTLA